MTNNQCLAPKENNPLFQGKGILYFENTKFPYGDTHESWIKRKYVDHNQHVNILRQTQVNTKNHK